MIESIGNKRSLKHSIDWVVIGIYLALVFIGWINIYASIHSTEPPSIFYWGARSGKQFVWMLTYFGLAAIILFLIPPRWWEGLFVPLYLLVLGLLVLVIFVSKDVKGSHSWFELGPVKFQPAEISKITTSLLLATVLSMQGFKMTRIKDFLKAAALIAVPMLVIIAESETGSALVYAGFIFVLYREGLSGWWLGAVGLVIALFVFTLFSGAYTSFLILAGVLRPGRGSQKARADAACRHCRDGVPYFCSGHSGLGFLPCPGPHGVDEKCCLGTPGRRNPGPVMGLCHGDYPGERVPCPYCDSPACPWRIHTAEKGILPGGTDRSIPSGRRAGILYGLHF